MPKARGRDERDGAAITVKVLKTKTMEAVKSDTPVHAVNVSRTFYHNARRKKADMISAVLGDAEAGDRKLQLIELFRLAASTAKEMSIARSLKDLKEESLHAKEYAQALAERSRILTRRSVAGESAFQRSTNLQPLASDDDAQRSAPAATSLLLGGFKPAHIELSAFRHRERKSVSSGYPLRRLREALHHAMKARGFLRSVQGEVNVTRLMQSTPAQRAHIRKVIEECEALAPARAAFKKEIESWGLGKMTAAAGAAYMIASQLAGRKSMVSGQAPSAEDAEDPGIDDEVRRLMADLALHGLRGDGDVTPADGTEAPAREAPAMQGWPVSGTLEEQGGGPVRAVHPTLALSDGDGSASPSDASSPRPGPLESVPAAPLPRAAAPSVARSFKSKRLAEQSVGRARLVRGVWDDVEMAMIMDAPPAMFSLTPRALVLHTAACGGVLQRPRGAAPAPAVPRRPVRPKACQRDEVHLDYRALERSGWERQPSASVASSPRDAQLHLPPLQGPEARTLCDSAMHQEDAFMARTKRGEPMKKHERESWVAEEDWQWLLRREDARRRQEATAASVQPQLCTPTVLPALVDRFVDAAALRPPAGGPPRCHAKMRRVRGGVPHVVHEAPPRNTDFKTC